MLSKIYIYRDREYSEYEWFCMQAQQAGVDIIEIDDIADGTCVIDVSDALVISCTDDIIKVIDINMRDRCLVGLGEEYSGSAEYIIYDFDITLNYIRLIYDRYNNIPHIIAQTDRIIMREMTVDDLPQMYELYDSIADCSYVESLYEYEKEKEFTINYINNMYRFFQYGLWLVFDRCSGKLIGRVGLENREIDGITRQELGYLIHSDYQRKGYACEACMCTIRYAEEELGIKELFACINTDNIPSINLAHKLGFVTYADDIDGMNIYYMHLT